MAAPTYWTAEMVRALPDDGNRYETVHGELLVAVALRAHLERVPAGHALASPVDISWGPEVLVQPDLFVAATEEVRTLDWSRVTTPVFAIEVLSPTTARYDRFTNRQLFRPI